MPRTHGTAAHRAGLDVVIERDVQDIDTRLNRGAQLRYGGPRLFGSLKRHVTLILPGSKRRAGLGYRLLVFVATHTAAAGLDGSAQRLPNVDRSRACASHLLVGGPLFSYLTHTLKQGLSTLGFLGCVPLLLVGVLSYRQQCAHWVFVVAHVLRDVAVLGV